MALNALVKAAEKLLSSLRDSSSCKRGERRDFNTEIAAAATALEERVQELAEERSRPGLVRSILVAVDNSEQRNGQSMKPFVWPKGSRRTFRC